MRLLAGLLVCLPLVAAAPADDYFELGLDYLKKGFYARARAALAESLVRAPGQPVTIAFLGVAAAAEGRSPRQCAALLRLAYRSLPGKKTLRLDLGKLLPSKKALSLVARDYEKHLKRKRPGALEVLAFLQVHDGDPGHAPALKRLLKESPKDAYALSLARAATGAFATTPPTSAGPSAGPAGSWSGRS